MSLKEVSYFKLDLVGKLCKHKPSLNLPNGVFASSSEGNKYTLEICGYPQCFFAANQFAYFSLLKSRVIGKEDGVELQDNNSQGIGLFRTFKR